ncbi:MAG: carbamoyl-phosphate synthase large subunit, partial [Pseudobdellovibrionaceae bacterium]
CEFDYSGTQACKELMHEGYQVILVNSNPATIMTDPEIAWKTYVEPLTLDYLEKIIEIEKPEAVIPTLGGQTALNLALELNDRGVLKKNRVQLLGATPEVIRAAEDREIFRSILEKVGAGFPKSYLVRSMDHGIAVGEELGYPIILRPNFTLGGGGGGIAYSKEEYHSMLLRALTESPTTEVLVETSIYGWKEFELEVMRDHHGTFVVVCTIENLDPCGVHTGDSITIAPQQTLSDGDYQAMRDEAKKILNEVGLETGGANIQFAVHPQTGERVVIEMNPRVSRSSALASKATGFPIAKIAALLAVGYRLDELKNDITLTTPCCYEPALDYVVTKIPRFAFEKFSGSKDHLSTQMKSVGEVMAIGRTFQESFQKALAALELHLDGIPDIEFVTEKLAIPNSQRIYYVIQAFRNKMSLDEVYNLTQIDHWFLEQIQDLVAFEFHFAEEYKKDLKTSLLRAKRKGFTDHRIAVLLSRESNSVSEDEVLNQRERHQILPC